MVLCCRYKQRGPEAEAADNVFHHLSYEGAARDIDAVADPRERAALEAQVQRLPACTHRGIAAGHGPPEAVYMS